MMWMIIGFGLGTAWILGFVLFSVIIRQRVGERKRRQEVLEDGGISIGLFHPTCYSGCGGSQRVLWVALKALQLRYPSAELVVYTVDVEASPLEILERAKERYNVHILNEGITFIYLQSATTSSERGSSSSPTFSHSLASIYMAIEALFKFVPDVYLDISDHSFTLPIFKYFGNCRVGAYINTPLVTMELLQRSHYNNGDRVYISAYSIRYITNLIYNRIFSYFYSWAGNSCDIVMVNSTYTEEHINYIWQCPSKTYVVFPPCDVQQDEGNETHYSHGEGDGDEDNGRDSPIKILSIGQFKGEKDHPLQIRILYQLREILRDEEWRRIKLLIVGSCRGTGDYNRVKDMQDLAKHLSVEGNVEFKVNLPYKQLKKEMNESMIGIHTMWNQQFGIGIVESMASGCILIANRSGGPLMDIIMEYDGSRNGFLATDENDYAEAIRNIIQMNPESRSIIRNQAKASVQRFSERAFNKAFMEAILAASFFK